MSNDSPILHPITHDRFLADVEMLARIIEADGWMPDMLVGVGRGGLVPTVYLSHRLNRPMLSVDYSNPTQRAAALLDTVAARSTTGTRLLIVDDINDSGDTIAQLRRLLAEGGSHPVNLRFAVLITNSRSIETVDYWADRIDRSIDKRWFVFPWEGLATQQSIVDEALSVPNRLE